MKDRISLPWLWVLGFALSALTCFINPAYAANAWNERDLSWKAPTTCSDGTTDLTLCVVTGYKVEAAGSCTATTWNALGATAANVTTLHATLNAGTYCFRVKATSSAGDSPPSTTSTGSQTVVVQPSVPPGAPGPVSVAVNATAYNLIKSETGLIVMLPVGVIATQTSCDATQAVITGGKTYNPVSPASVRFTGSVKSVLPFAICG
jgi:hypothetical protein